MKVKIIQDSIVFISGLTKEELMKASRFTPEALTLYESAEDGKKKTPTCMVGYSNDGGISANGVIYDSTTDDGFMCHTIVAAQGEDPHCTAEEKVKCISESYSGLILKMNTLEAQIKAALSEKETEIALAEESVEVINL